MKKMNENEYIGPKGQTYNVMEKTLLALAFLPQSNSVVGKKIREKVIDKQPVVQVDDIMIYLNNLKCTYGSYGRQTDVLYAYISDIEELPEYSWDCLMPLVLNEHKMTNLRMNYITHHGEPCSGSELDVCDRFQLKFHSGELNRTYWGYSHYHRPELSSPCLSGSDFKSISPELILEKIVSSLPKNISETKKFKNILDFMDIYNRQVEVSIGEKEGRYYKNEIRNGVFIPSL